MPPLTATKTSRKVGLNLRNWFKICETFQLDSCSKRAQAFGTSRVNVNQIELGNRNPGNEFIAGVMAYMAPRGVKFEQLFTWPVLDA